MLLAFGFYFTQVMVPYRQMIERFSETLTTLRLKWEDTLETCIKDPELKDAASIVKMRQLQKVKNLNEILNKYQEKRYPLLSKLTAYTHLLKFAKDPYSEKIYQKVGDFLTWNWDQHTYIETTQNCPPKLVSGKELYDWQDEIISVFPNAAIIHDQLLTVSN